MIGSPPVRDLKALLSYVLGSTPVSTRRLWDVRADDRRRRPLMDACVFGRQIVAKLAFLHTCLCSPVPTLHRGGGRRGARGARARRGKQGGPACTTKPREPTITHDGGYGGTRRYTIGAADATAKKRAATGGGRPPALLKRGRCRDGASREGCQLRLVAGSEGACIDVHPSAAIYTRPSNPIEKQIAPLYQLIV